MFDKVLFGIRGNLRTGCRVIASRDAHRTLPVVGQRRIAFVCVHCQGLMANYWRIDKSGKFFGRFVKYGYYLYWFPSLPSHSNC